MMLVLIINLITLILHVAPAGCPGQEDQIPAQLDATVKERQAVRGR